MPEYARAMTEKVQAQARLDVATARVRALRGAELRRLVAAGLPLPPVPPETHLCTVERDRCGC